MLPVIQISRMNPTTSQPSLEPKQNSTLKPAELWDDSIWNRAAKTPIPAPRYTDPDDEKACLPKSTFTTYSPNLRRLLSLRMRQATCSSLWIGSVLHG